MAVTATSVKTLFPELATVADATVERWLAIAELRHNVDAWGTKSDTALTFLTAHLVELDRRRQAGATGTAAAVASRSVGDVSISFSLPQPPSTSDAVLASTNAGQLYLELREGIFADRVI